MRPESFQAASRDHLANDLERQTAPSPAHRLAHRSPKVATDHLEGRLPGVWETEGAHVPGRDSDSDRVKTRARGVPSPGRPCHKRVLRGSGAGPSRYCGVRLRLSPKLGEGRPQGAYHVRLRAREDHRGTPGAASHRKERNVSPHFVFRGQVRRVSSLPGEDFLEDAAGSASIEVRSIDTPTTCGGHTTLTVWAKRRFQHDTTRQKLLFPSATLSRREKCVCT